MDRSPRLDSGGCTSILCDCCGFRHSCRQSAWSVQGRHGRGALVSRTAPGGRLTVVVGGPCCWRRDMRLVWREPADGDPEVRCLPHPHPTWSLRTTAPAGTVAVFDARLWHRRRDSLGTRIRRAMFMAYSSVADLARHRSETTCLRSAVRLLDDKTGGPSTGPPVSSRSIPRSTGPKGA